MLKKLLFFGFLLIAIAFTACQDSNDEKAIEEAVTSGSLYGTWEVITEKGSGIYRGETYTINEDYSARINDKKAYAFTSDGMMYILINKGNGWRVDFNIDYVFKDNCIYADEYSDGEYIKIDHYIIVSISNKRLVLHWEYDEGDNRESDYINSTITLNKVSDSIIPFSFH